MRWFTCTTFVAIATSLLALAVLFPANADAAASLTITPSSSEIEVGRGLAFTATYKASATATPTVISPVYVTWSTGDPLIASVSQGIVSGIAPGATTLTGKFLGVAGTAAITVVPPPPPPADPPVLVISPSSTVIGVNGTNRFYAVYYPTGPASSLPVYVDPALVTWKSDKPLIASVAGGVAYGIMRGTATITAKYQGLKATAPVTVAGKVKAFSLVTPDGLTRTYSLYIPDVKSTPAPLVLVFHGRGGVDRGMMHVTQFSALAHQKGFFAAFPNGTGEVGDWTWNCGGCTAPAASGNVDDVGFTRLMIADISARQSVDPKRIFATGLSNGGVFVHRLGFELADQIAAIAPVSGGLLPGGDFVPAPPVRRVPVIEFHGTTDEMYRYDPAIPWTIDQWLERNEIPAQSPAVVYQNGNATCESWVDGAAEVVLCTIDPPVVVEVDGVHYDGGGHVWPGGVKGNTAWSDVPTMDVVATNRIWKFFSAHPME